MKRGAKMALLRSVNDGEYGRERDYDRDYSQGGRMNYAGNYGRRDGGGEQNHERYGDWETNGRDWERRHDAGDRNRMRRMERREDDWGDDGEQEGEHNRGRRMIQAGGTFWMNDPEAGQAMRPMDESAATTWVKKMRNADGSTGEHFTRAQAEQQRQAICPQCGTWAYYAAINMMYSDYCEVAKKMGLDRPDFYAHMAKAFLEDGDAGKNKIEKYKRYIAGD